MLFLCNSTPVDTSLLHLVRLHVTLALNDVSQDGRSLDHHLALDIDILDSSPTEICENSSIYGDGLKDVIDVKGQLDLILKVVIAVMFPHIAVDHSTKGGQEIEILTVEEDVVETEHEQFESNGMAEPGAELQGRHLMTFVPLLWEQTLLSVSRALDGSPWVSQPAWEEIRMVP